MDWTGCPRKGMFLMEQNNKSYMYLGAWGLAVVAAFCWGRLSVPASPQLPKVVENPLSPPIQKTPTALQLDIHDDVESVDEKGLGLPEGDELELQAKNEAEALAAHQKFAAWAKTDPLAALAFATEQERGRGDCVEAVTAILHEWVKVDPEATWLWAQEHSPNHSVDLLKEIAKVDPTLAWAAATQYAQQYPEHLHAAYTAAIEGVIHNGNYLVALELLDASTIPVTDETEKGKDYFIDGLIAEWARYSPTDALAWIEGLPEDSSRRQGAYDALLSSWATTEPIDALDYALTLSGGGAREDTIDMSISYLAEHDLAAASAWLNEHGEGPEFDWSVSEIATKPAVIRETPETAVDWALSIETPGIREDSLVQIFTDWMVNDLEGARRYLQENGDLLSQEAFQKAARRAQLRINRASAPPENGGIL